MNRNLELGLTLLAVICLVVVSFYYVVYVYPDIQYYNKQLAKCNCSAICAGKSGYYLPGLPRGSEIVTN